jgi:hypothetical protein
MLTEIQQSAINNQQFMQGFRGVLSSIGWSRVSPAKLDGRGARRRQNPVSPFLARWRFHGASFSRKRVDASMNPTVSRVKRDPEMPIGDCECRCGQLTKLSAAQQSAIVFYSAAPISCSRNGSAI